MADENKVRAKLVVTSVATPRKVGESNVVVDFKAHIEGQEEARGYETWGQLLVDLVKSEATLDCEITDIQKGDQIHHRITQMFDSEGKPIRPMTRGGGKGGGGGYYGKNPETTAIERASIEATNAFMGTIELIKANTITLEHNLAKTALNWAEKKIQANMGVKAPVQEVRPPVTKPAEPKVETKVAEDKPKAKPAETLKPKAESEKPEEKTPLTEATRHKIAEIIAQRKYDPLVVQAHIQRVYLVATSRDLTEKQGQELLAWVEKGEIEPGKGIPVSKEA